MWISTSIIILGAWLMVSPVFFLVTVKDYLPWLHDLIIGLSFVCFGFANYIYSKRLISILLILLSVWCIFHGYLFYRFSNELMAINYIIIGTLTAIFTIFLSPHTIIKKDKKKLLNFNY